MSVDVPRSIRLLASGELDDDTADVLAAVLLCCEGVAWLAERDDVDVATLRQAAPILAAAFDLADAGEYPSPEAALEAIFDVLAARELDR